MRRHLRSALILAAFLLGLQAALVGMVWEETFEAWAVIQVFPPSHHDFSEDVCNVETVRGLLESPDLAAEIRQRFSLDPDFPGMNTPLVTRRMQEIDPGMGTLRFRFRHTSPEVARDVVQTLLTGIETRWQEAVRARTRHILQLDAKVLDMNLGQFDRQLASMPPLRPVLQVATGSPWAAVLPAFVAASPHFEDVRTQRQNLERRRTEIGIILAGPGGAPDLVPRWRVVVPPVVPRHPVWPSRADLLKISLLNAILWSGAWLLYRCWIHPPSGLPAAPTAPTGPA